MEKDCSLIYQFSENMKTTSSEYVTYINFCFCFDIQNNLCTQHVLSLYIAFMYWTGKSMNNLLSYCGLIDTRIRASDKDLPVLQRSHYCIRLQNQIMLNWPCTKSRPYSYPHFQLTLPIYVSIYLNSMYCTGFLCTRYIFTVSVIQGMEFQRKPVSMLIVTYLQEFMNSAIDPFLRNNF